MKVYVETNFVLELALEQPQHAECEEILRLAESKSVKIALPAFSFFESARKLERSHRGRKGLFRKVASEIQQLRRSIAFTEAADAVDASVQALIAKTIQQEKSRLRNLHFRLLNAAHVLPLSAEVFAGVEEVRDRFPELETADAIVLTSVLKDPTLGSGPACFLNRDRKGFDDPAIRPELVQRQCKLMGSFVDGRGYIGSQISR